MLDAGSGVDAQGADPQLHPIDALLGVITSPVQTMRAIAAVRPWLWGIAVTVGAGLLGGLASLTAPDPGATGDTAFMPPELQAALAATRSPWFVVVNGLILAPLGLVIGTAVLYGVGHLFGGQGTYSGLLSTVAFASVPAILLAPITAWLNLAGGPFMVLSGLLGVGFSVWIIVLHVIAIREGLDLSTGRSVLTLLVPLVGLMLLSILFGVVFAMMTLGGQFA
jgi:hypothetical protein